MNIYGRSLNIKKNYPRLVTTKCPLVSSLLAGVYAENTYGKTRFYPVKAPTTDELNGLVHTISQRVARKLEREGLLERDGETSYLKLDSLEEDPVLCQFLYHAATGN